MIKIGPYFIQDNEAGNEQVYLVGRLEHEGIKAEETSKRVETFHI